jgi:transposase
MVKRPTNRRYTEEFKRDAVALVRSSGRPIAEVARELGITDTSLGNWIREVRERETPAEAAAAEAAAVEAAETARLRKRVRELEQEVEILKRFTAYWVRSEGDR